MNLNRIEVNEDFTVEVKDEEIETTNLANKMEDVIVIDDDDCDIPTTALSTTVQKIKEEIIVIDDEEEFSIKTEPHSPENNTILNQTLKIKQELISTNELDTFSVVKEEKIEAEDHNLDNNSNLLQIKKEIKEEVVEEENAGQEPQIINDSANKLTSSAINCNQKPSSDNTSENSVIKLSDNVNSTSHDKVENAANSSKCEEIELKEFSRKVPIFSKAHNRIKWVLLNFDRLRKMRPTHVPNDEDCTIKLEGPNRRKVVIDIPKDPPDYKEPELPKTKRNGHIDFDRNKEYCFSMRRSDGSKKYIIIPMDCFLDDDDSSSSMKEVSLNVKTENGSSSAQKPANVSVSSPVQEDSSRVLKEKNNSSVEKIVSPTSSSSKKDVSSPNARRNNENVSSSSPPNASTSSTDGHLEKGLQKPQRVSISSTVSVEDKTSSSSVQQTSSSIVQEPQISLKKPQNISTSSSIKNSPSSLQKNSSPTVQKPHSFLSSVTERGVEKAQNTSISSSHEDKNRCLVAQQNSSTVEKGLPVQRPQSSLSTVTGKGQAKPPKEDHIFLHIQRLDIPSSSKEKASNVNISTLVDRVEQTLTNKQNDSLQKNIDELLKNCDEILLNVDQTKESNVKQKKPEMLVAPMRNNSVTKKPLSPERRLSTSIPVVQIRPFDNNHRRNSAPNTSSNPVSSSSTDQRTIRVLTSVPTTISSVNQRVSSTSSTTSVSSANERSPSTAPTITINRVLTSVPTTISSVDQRVFSTSLPNTSSTTAVASANQRGPSSTPTVTNNRVLTSVPTTISSVNQRVLSTSLPNTSSTTAVSSANQRGPSSTPTVTSNRVLTSVPSAISFAKQRVSSTSLPNTSCTTVVSSGNQRIPSSVPTVTANRVLTSAPTTTSSINQRVFSTSLPNTSSIIAVSSSNQKGSYSTPTVAVPTTVSSVKQRVSSTSCTTVVSSANHRLPSSMANVTTNRVLTSVPTTASINQRVSSTCLPTTSTTVVSSANQRSPSSTQTSNSNRSRSVSSVPNTNSVEISSVQPLNNHSPAIRQKFLLSSNPQTNPSNGPPNGRISSNLQQQNADTHEAYNRAIVQQLQTVFNGIVVPENFPNRRNSTEKSGDNTKTPQLKIIAIRNESLRQDRRTPLLQKNSPQGHKSPNGASFSSESRRRPSTESRPPQQAMNSVHSEEKKTLRQDPRRASSNYQLHRKTVGENSQKTVESSNQNQSMDKVKLVRRRSSEDFTPPPPRRSLTQKNNDEESKDQAISQLEKAMSSLNNLQGAEIQDTLKLLSNVHETLLKQRMEKEDKTSTNQDRSSDSKNSPNKNQFKAPQGVPLRRPKSDQTSKEISSTAGSSSAIQTSAQTKNSTNSPEKNVWKKSYDQYLQQIHNKQVKISASQKPNSQITNPKGEERKLPPTSGQHQVGQKRPATQQETFSKRVRLDETPQPGGNDAAEVETLWNFEIRSTISEFSQQTSVHRKPDENLTKLPEYTSELKTTKWLNVHFSEKKNTARKRHHDKDLPTHDNKSPNLTTKPDKNLTMHQNVIGNLTINQNPAHQSTTHNVQNFDLALLQNFMGNLAACQNSNTLTLASNQESGNFRGNQGGNYLNEAALALLAQNPVMPNCPLPLQAVNMLSAALLQQSRQTAQTVSVNNPQEVAFSKPKKRKRRGKKKNRPENP